MFLRLTKEELEEKFAVLKKAKSHLHESTHRRIWCGVIRNELYFYFHDNDITVLKDSQVESEKKSIFRKNNLFLIFLRNASSMLAVVAILLCAGWFPSDSLMSLGYLLLFVVFSF